MNRVTALSIVLSLLLLAGCAGPKQTGITPKATQETLDNVPDWYLNVPSKEDIVFTTGTATSRDLQLARDKARDVARLDMAKNIETKFDGLSKRFQEEVGTGTDAQYLDQFTQATKAVVSQVLSGTSIEKTEIKNEQGLFRAYVLLKMPVGAASQALLNKLKQQEQLYTRFRSTQVFEELEKDADKFQNWKDNQGTPPK